MKRMKLLMLTRYDRLGASSRVRSHLYLPWLKDAGIDATVSALFSDDYVSRLQRGQKRLSEIATAYPARLRALGEAKDFELIWIEKEALPWLPFWIEANLFPRDVPYVLDYDDAIFHYYDTHERRFVRAVLGGKIPALMRGAELVLAGNRYLGDFARRSGARRLEILPTVIDLQRYGEEALARRCDRAEPPLIGWIGQRATAPLLLPYRDLFARMSASGIARFAAVGIDAAAHGLSMESVPWTEETEVASVARFDIGIMPLVDKPFERGKCGYKLVQYMACGLPVVASPVGVNRQLVEHGVNGFLAETMEQWESSLRALLFDADLRRRMGQAGRRKVEREYCVQVTGPRFASLLMEAAGRRVDHDTFSKTH